MSLACALLGACSSPPAEEPSVCAGLDASVSDAARGPCPEDRPANCPDAGVPSYQVDIAPLMHARCGPCHEPGGIEANRLYTEYGPVARDRTQVLNQVYQCRMPPSCAPPLSPEERNALLQWLICRAPDN